MRQCNRRREGYTMIEVSVVIIILALVAAIFFIVIGKLIEMGRQNTCMSHQRQIVDAILMQAQDNGEMLPTADLVWGQVNLGRQVLTCPTKGDERNDYVYSLKVSGETLGLFPQASTTAVIADGVHTPTASSPLPNIGYEDTDAEKRHNGQLIACYLDGHAGLASRVSLNADDLCNWITGVGVTAPPDATVTASSSANGVLPAKLIDGAASADPSTSWLSGGLSNEWVQIDLGRRQPVSEIRCWNYCQPNNNGCGAKTLEIYVDDIAQPDGSPFSTAHAQGLNVSLAQSTSSCAYSSVWKLPLVTGGRYVTLALSENYGGSSVGLAEVGIGVAKTGAQPAGAN